MKRRILALALALLMMVSVFPAPTFAADAAESGSVVGRLVRVKSDFNGTAYATPGVFGGVFCGASYFPERLVITAVETVSGTTYYQLSVAEGYTWPELANNVNLTDGYWLKSENVEIIESEEPTEPTEPVETDPTEPVETDPTEPVETDPTEPVETDPTEPVETDPTEPVETDPTEPAETDPTEPVETDPTEPSEPEEVPSISDTVNGQTITVSGEALPEGAELNTVSLNQSIGIALELGDDMYIADIFVTDAMGNEWQPEIGQNVTVRLPVSNAVNGARVDVVHILDTSDAVRAAISDGSAEIEDVSGYGAYFEDEIAAWQEATGSSGQCVALVYIRDLVASNGYVQFETDSFSLYVWNTGGWYADNQTGSGDTQRILFYTDDAWPGDKIFVTRGSNIYTETGLWAFNFRGFWYENSDYVSKIEDTGYNSTNGKSRGGVFYVATNAPTDHQFHIRVESVGSRDTSYVYFHVLDRRTVNFDANGGSNLEYTSQVALAHGNNTVEVRRVAMPSVTPPTGYKLDGWYTAKNGGTKIAGDKGSWVPPANSTTPDYTTTVYAQYVPIDYNITYNLGGGTASNPATYNIETATFTLNNPTKAGYTFTGWTGTELSAATKTVTIAKGSTGARNYVANWTANTYTLNYNANGGSVSPASKSVTYNSKYGTLAVPTREGYTFDGWYTAASGGTKVTADTVYQTAGDSTVYAHWSPVNYSVSFNGNGATSGSMANQSFTFNTAQNLTANAYKREYTVTFNTDGGNTIAQETVKATFNGWEDRGSIVYEGTTWNYTDFDAPYYGNNSTDVFNHAQFGNGHYNKYGLLKHYVLHGQDEWQKGSASRAPTGSAPGLYPDGALVSNLSSTAGYVVPLYANWTLGSIILPTPTKANYNFEGWTDGSTTYAAGAVYTPTANVTLTALWKANDYVVTGTIDNGGTVTNGSQTVTHGENSAAMVFTPAPGYRITGITVNGAAQAVANEDSYTYPATKVTGNIEVKVTTEVKEFTITYVLGNGQANIVETYKYGEAITAPEKPAWAGYEFLGWDQEIPETMPAENLTITAQWKLALVDLTIAVTGNWDTDQSFAFLVKDSGGNVVARVVIPAGKNSITIKNVPVGTYTVVPADGWAWRLTSSVANDGQVELTESKTVTFNWSFAANLIYWLNGCSYNIKKGG